MYKDEVDEKVREIINAVTGKSSSEESAPTPAAPAPVSDAVTAISNATAPAVAAVSNAAAAVAAPSQKAEDRELNKGLKYAGIATVVVAGALASAAVYHKYFKTEEQASS